MRVLVVTALVLLAVVPLLAAPPKEKKTRKKPRPTEPPPPPPEIDYDVEASQGPAPDLNNYNDLLDYDSDLLGEPKEEAGTLTPKVVAKPKPPADEKPQAPPPPPAGDRRTEGEGQPGLFGQEAPPIGLPTCLLCVCLRGSVYCDDNDLDVIPPLPRDTSYFYARYNRISSVRLADFQGLTRLKRVDLSNNEVATVEAGALAGLVALEELHLGSNQLTVLPALPSGIRLLDMQHNRLTSSGVGVDTFKDMKQLAYLYLGDNQLDHVPVPLPNSLRVLHLQNNNVQEIRDDTFCNPKDSTYLRRGMEDIRLDGNPVNLSRTPNAYVCLPRLPTGRTH